MFFRSVSMKIASKAADERSSSEGEDMNDSRLVQRAITTDGHDRRRRSVRATVGVLHATRAVTRWFREGQLGASPSVEVARWSGARV